jgi:DNA-binding transcriptional ArsR family regulator
LPRARSRELITEEIGDELLVYDERSDRAHCLSSEAAHVWRRCDGTTPVGHLAAAAGLDEQTVQRALEDLTACELLEAPPLVGDGSTRRELGVKLVRAGGVAAMAPLILSVVAPTPAAAVTVGCEAVNACLCNCGSNTFGCKGVSCTCCQLTALPNSGSCPGGQLSNMKRCIAGASASCAGVSPTVCCGKACP